jgi:hypothetical protein
VSHEGATSGHSSRHDEGDDQGPPHPSSHLPCSTVMSIRGWPMHYPDVHTTLLSLRDPINPVCASTQLKLAHRGQTIGP